MYHLFLSFTGISDAGVVFIGSDVTIILYVCTCYQILKLLN